MLGQAVHNPLLRPTPPVVNGCSGHVRVMRSRLPARTRLAIGLACMSAEAKIITSQVKVLLGLKKRLQQHFFDSYIGDCFDLFQEARDRQSFTVAAGAGEPTEPKGSRTRARRSRQGTFGGTDSSVYHGDWSCKDLVLLPFCCSLRLPSRQEQLSRVPTMLTKPCLRT